MGWIQLCLKEVEKVFIYFCVLWFVTMRMYYFSIKVIKKIENTAKCFELPIAVWHLSSLDTCIFWGVFYFFNYLIIYFWLCWVFVAAHRLSLVEASGGYSSLRCAGFSLRWLLLLWSTGSRHAGSELWHVGSVVVAHGLSCSAACGIFPDQGLNPCPLHWLADS